MYGYEWVLWLIVIFSLYWYEKHLIEQKFQLLARAADLEIQILQRQIDSHLELINKEKQDLSEWKETVVNYIDNRLNV